MRGEFVDIRGFRVYYYAAGSRGVGDPVVFLHGFPTSSRLWHAVVRDFPPGHRLVVCDLPGFGRSDPPRAFSVGSWASDIVGMLDELRIPRACLVGHGLGGTIARRVLQEAPSRVTHLALLATPPSGVAPRHLARLARLLLPLAERAPPGFLAGLVQGSVLRGFADPERSRLTLDTCLQPFTTQAGRRLLASHLRVLTPSSGETARTISTDPRVPTAILWGGADPFYPPALAEQLRDAIPDATLEIIPGASHFIPEDAPERVIATLNALLAR